MNRRKQLKRWSLFVLTAIVVFLVNLPIITLVLNSLRTTHEILTSSSLIPANPSLVNYIYVSQRTPYWRFFVNSLITAGGGMTLSMSAGMLAGYALSRFHSRLLRVYARGLFLVQMFPLILALIPLFILFRTLGLANKYPSVIILYTVVQLPFATVMFRAFFDGIPRDLEDAAHIDGCSQLQGFAQVVLPLSGPAIAAVAIFTFLFSYNEYMIANILLRNENVYTLPVGLQMFMQQFGTDWGSLMAASTMAMLPTFVLFLFVQKYVMYGAIGAGVKG